MEETGNFLRSAEQVLTSDSEEKCMHLVMTTLSTSITSLMSVSVVKGRMNFSALLTRYSSVEIMGMREKPTSFCRGHDFSASDLKIPAVPTKTAGTDACVDSICMDGLRKT